MQMEMTLEGGGPLTARRPKGRKPPLGTGEAGRQMAFDLAKRAEASVPIPAVELVGGASGDFAGSPPVPAAPARAERGRRGYLTGLAAEDSVARHYTRKGRMIAARRWRGPGGEIDMIVREGARLVFVEVKASRSFDAAICRLTRRQIDRICRSAEAYCGAAPDGLLTEMRFDLALVDARGAVRVVENAFDAG